MLVGCQPEAQPQCAARFGGLEVVKVDGAELIGVASRANVAQFQIALFVEQYRPGTARRGLGREHAEQRQQRNGQAYGNPEPAHGEIPS
jgi:hypothetical protein